MRMSMAAVQVRGGSVEPDSPRKKLKGMDWFHLTNAGDRTLGHGSYLSLHEYEGLLFSDPDALAHALRQPSLAHPFHQVRNDFPTREDINDDPESAPSKRVIAIYPAYRKVIEGALAAKG